MKIVSVNIPKPPESTATVDLTLQEVRIIRKSLETVSRTELSDVDATWRCADELLFSMQQLEAQLR